MYGRVGAGVAGRRVGTLASPLVDLTVKALQAFERGEKGGDACVARGGPSSQPIVAYAPLLPMAVTLASPLVDHLLNPCNVDHQPQVMLDACVALGGPSS